MSRRFISAALAIALAALLSALHFPHPWVSRDLSKTSLNDSESRLSIFKGVRLEVAEQQDLELVPGISNKLAEDFLDRRDKVLSQAAKLPVDQRYHAMETVKGIGKKGARKFDQYIELAPSSNRVTNSLCRLSRRKAEGD